MAEEKKYWTVAEFVKHNKVNGWPSRGVIYKMTMEWSKTGRKGKHFVNFRGSRILIDPEEFYKWLEENKKK